MSVHELDEATREYWRRMVAWGRERPPRWRWLKYRRWLEAKPKAPESPDGVNCRCGAPGRNE